MIIFGNEGRGISKEIQNIVDNSIFIKPATNENEIVFPQTLLDSLNVGVSSGILIN